MRKMISFKIENLPDKQRQIIDTWADGQSNIQQSLANIVMHIVDFVGNDDVMDFDVQKKLHMIFAQELPIEVFEDANSMKYYDTVKIPETVPGSVEVVDKGNDEEPGEQPTQADNDVIKGAFEVFDEEENI